MLSPTQTQKFVDEMWMDSIVPELVEYIKIPNKSPHFDPDWEANGYMEDAVQQIFAWCTAQDIKGMKSEIVRLPGRTPLIFLEIDGTDEASEDTILLYGHLDKQPEMTGWADGLGPWIPVIREDKLYGRGGADDGYAAYGSLPAIMALQREGLSHARCVVIIEACEESGSYDLPFYIDHLSDRIGQPSLVICLDSGAGNYEQLWLTTSLRGMVSGSLQVEVLEEGERKWVSPMEWHETLYIDGVKLEAFTTSGGLGTMGYAIPAAIGAKVACPERQVVAFCGDGGFQMTACELAARWTSLSVTVPTALWMTSRSTLLDSILLRDSQIASTEPWVSALTMTLSTLAVVASICSNRFSRVTPAARPSSFSLWAASPRFSARSRAAFSLSTELNSSPASGTPLRPSSFTA